MILPLFLSPTLTAAPLVRVNAVGYETNAPKVAVAQDEETLAETGFEILDATGKVVHSGIPGGATAVPGWANMSFQTVDFSTFKDSGLFTLRLQPSATVSDTFRIGEARLFRTAAPAVVAFFNGMRNDNEDDRAIPYFGDEARGTHDVFGGWNDATGDQGKYLSHLSYANFMNPQQIPLVAWSLLRSSELAGPRAAGIPFLAEALWGADYLLRVQDPAGYFYINVFNEGWHGDRTICAWIGDAEKQGISTGDYQAAWREGGGMSIAALAFASRTGAHGDSSSAQYLAGAKRGFAHLSASYGKWADDKKENLIDHTTALMAAIELALATERDPVYLQAAGARVDSILVRQTPEGWFWTDGGTRPWFHAVDEGLPLVALSRYFTLDSLSPRAQKVQAALRLSLDWYRKATYEVSNPFSYPRMVVPAEPPPLPGVGNKAVGKNASASSIQMTGNEAAKAFDGVATTRWSSDLQDSTGWLAVDLGDKLRIDSVVVVWEAAHAKEYVIEISSDSSTWTEGAKATASGAGRVGTALAGSPAARYVRFRGLVRSSPSYSYSIYEFEVYGHADELPPEPKPVKTAFFMPHQNETGYWWQGENARLGSMATGLIAASQVVDPLWRLTPSDTISRMATASLEWVGGANPTGRSFIEGIGSDNPPGYMGTANTFGGIANGITASVDDESTPEFMHYDNPSSWENWRWVEQWLPHDAWYLLGISSIANAQERPIDVGVAPRAVTSRPIHLVREGMRLSATSRGALRMELRTLDGRILSAHSGETLSWTLSGSSTVLVVAVGPQGYSSRLVAPLP